MKYAVSCDTAGILGYRLIEADKFAVLYSYTDASGPQGDLCLSADDRLIAYFPGGRWTSIREDDTEADKFTDATKRAAT